MKIGRSFIQQSHFKKWYKKGYLGILDFVLINDCNAFNMSAQLKGIFGDIIDNSNWRQYVANLMLNWKDPKVEDIMTVMLLPVGYNHDPISVLYSQIGCV